MAARHACMLLLLSGCGVLLFVDDDEERPRPKPAADAAAAPTSGPAPPTDDGGGDAAIDDGMIDCLGVRRPAFFCDGFESTPVGSAPQPPWVRVLAPPNSPSEADIVVANERTFAGAQALRASVGGGLLATGTRRAQVRWQRPNEPGPLALQFRVNIVGTVVWDEDDESIVAALRPAGGGVAAVVRFIASGNLGGRFVLEPETGLIEVELGTVPFNQWRCIQLVADEQGVSASVGASRKGTVPVPMAAESVELGMATSVKGTQMVFDDVIISATPVADCAP